MRYLILLLALLISACQAQPIIEEEVPETPVEVVEEIIIPEVINLKLTQVHSDISLSQITEMQVAHDGSNRLYILERAGRIIAIDESGSSSVFLDLRNRVDSSSGEKGLLGLAFHPEFMDNGKFYLNYTTRNQTRVAQYQLSDDTALADSEVILLTMNQPYTNHNGGQLLFGPDGYLYIATGDGGSSGDPQNNSQNLSSLLGKLLRIDVNSSSDDKAYAIPIDNPFYQNSESYHEEIYAYGLRNPWKFSFDVSSQRLWLADVGQNRIEEINLIQNGGNYGWRIMEGTECYSDSACDKSAYELPVYEYTHDHGQSITGGYVYWGQGIPELFSAYIYGDFVSGNIWALWLDGDGNVLENRLLIESGLNISSFGVDEHNELYILDYAGAIYQFEPVGE